MHVFSIGRSQHLYFQGVMRLFDWPNFLVAAMLLQVNSWLIVLFVLCARSLPSMLAHLLVLEFTLGVGLLACLSGAGGGLK